ncbi:hypothetical protein FHR80_000707 [Cellulomonas cellasea]|uniref:Uncharacterized protein n=1 Tax=Cellulomonas cellasea TaxID=43670 RepID=A0A7W4UDZ6_9CELL|nr:hypothetical protein [Cellulomonas cellasea]
MDTTRWAVTVAAVLALAGAPAAAGAASPAPECGRPAPAP